MVESGPDSSIGYPWTARTAQGRLISALIRTGDTETFRAKGNTPAMMEVYGDEWSWITRYIGTHGRMPSAEAFTVKFHEFALADLSDVAHHCAEVIREHDRTIVLRVLREGLDLVAEDDTDRAKAVLVRYASAVSLNGSRGRVRSRLASDVAVEPVDWLWPDRIPLAAVSLLEGQPKCAKSTIAVDIAARVTTGRAMPHDDDPATSYGPMGVVILSAEDHPGRVIRPRLEAAGGDLSRVRIVDGVDDLDDHGNAYLRPVSLPEDLPHVESIVREAGAGLVIVDPLMAYLSARVKGSVDQDVRRALFPLRELAEATGAAVLIIRHFRKEREGDAINWGGGSIGIAGAARSILQVGKDPDDRSKYVMVHTASNYGAECASLAYRIEGMQTKLADTSRVEWIGESSLKPEDLGSSRGPGRPADRREEVAAWLEDELGNGPDLRQKIMVKADALGYAQATVQLAARELGVRRSRDGKQVVWGLDER